MTTDQRVSLMCCTWDRLLGFMRQKYPNPGIYGGDTGGQAPKLVEVLGRPDEMARVADALFKIDCAFEVATAPLREKLKKAQKDKEDAERMLLETVK